MDRGQSLIIPPLFNGKSSKGKSMALKAKSNDFDESSDDEDPKMKSYIT